MPVTGVEQMSAACLSKIAIYGNYSRRPQAPYRLLGTRAPITKQTDVWFMINESTYAVQPMIHIYHTILWGHVVLDFTSITLLSTAGFGPRR